MSEQASGITYHPMVASTATTTVTETFHDRLLNPDVVDELRRVERKPTPSMLCEVCDRPPLWSVNRGKGWSVRYWPHRERIALIPVAEFRSSNFVGYTVFTCGDEICVWRAVHHGYPGMLTSIRVAPDTVSVAR